MKSKIIKIIIFLLIISHIPLSLVMAHSGGTDASGGHRDTKNASGLGSYHYHHGYGPHLHPNGVCQYSNNSTQSFSSSAPAKASIKGKNIPSTISSGEIIPLEWEVLNSDYNADRVLWSSSDHEIIAVSSHGLLTAVKPGTATITASLPSIEKKYTVTVNEVRAKSFSISNKIEEIEVNRRATLSPLFEPNNTTYKEINWSTSNDEVASISSTGTIKALKVGNTIITGTTLNGITNSFELRVFEILPTSIETTFENLSFLVGDDQKLDAEVIPFNATYNEIEWSVKDTSIATIDKNNKIVAIGVGESTVILKCKDVIKEIPLQVNPIEVLEVNITHNDVPYAVSNAIRIGTKFTPNIRISPENATYKTYELISNNPKVLEVDGDSVKVVGWGSAVLTIRSGSVIQEVDFRGIDLNAIYTGGGMLVTFAFTGIMRNYKQKKKKKSMTEKEIEFKEFEHSILPSVVEDTYTSKPVLEEPKSSKSTNNDAEPHKQDVNEIFPQKPQMIISNGDKTVYITNSGKKYHNPGCYHKGTKEILLSVAKKKGYEPCKSCNP